MLMHFPSSITNSLFKLDTCSSSLAISSNMDFLTLSYSQLIHALKNQFFSEQFSNKYHLYQYL